MSASLTDAAVEEQVLRERTVQPAEVTRIVAVRHGETAWNADHRIQGQLDIDLNEKGRWQARRVASALQSEGLQAIYSSDLLRAWNTAAEIGVACGLPIEPQRLLRERSFGVFEGHRWDEIAARWPAECASWRSRDEAFTPEGGESLLEFSARAVGVCESIAKKHRGGVVLLVAHGGVMDCLYRAATRLGLTAPRTWMLANAAVNRLLCSPEGFSLVGWSDTSHLDDEAIQGELG